MLIMLILLADTQYLKDLFSYAYKLMLTIARFVCKITLLARVGLVCKIPLLARALGIKAKRTLDDMVSFIQVLA